MPEMSKSWSSIAITLTSLLFALSAYAASPLTWKPQQHVELLVPTASGSGTDTQTRIMQRLFQDKRLVETTVTVSNKAGGGGAIALAYLNQHAGNGHYLMVTSPTLLTNHITGRTSSGHQDVTPLAQIGSEYVVFAVRADSRFRNGTELAEGFRKELPTLTVALANSLGNGSAIWKPTCSRTPTSTAGTAGSTWIPSTPSCAQ